MLSWLYQLFDSNPTEGGSRHALETDPNALLRQAEKDESGATTHFPFTSYVRVNKEKLEAAAGVYIDAANAFRMANQQEQAGKAFARAAELQTDLNQGMDAANTYQDAFKMYRKIDPQRAIDYLNITINTWAYAGNLHRAATKLQSVGETYETEYFEGLDNTAAKLKAIEAYAKAAKWYEDEKYPALASKLHLKVAELAASIGQIKGSGPDYEYDGYIIASDIFQEAAENSVSNNLMKWSVKDYLLKAGICRLAHDSAGMIKKLKEYRNIDLTFDSTMEYQLLVDLTEAVKNKDAEKFIGKLSEYDQKSKIDNWKSGILRHIKDKLDKEVDKEVVDDFS